MTCIIVGHFLSISKAIVFKIRPLGMFKTSEDRNFNKFIIKFKMRLSILGESPYIGISYII